jgi:hypothetical protein
MTTTLTLVRLGDAKRLTQAGPGILVPEKFEPFRYDGA